MEHIGAAGSSYAELSTLDENTFSSSEIEKMSTAPSCSSEGLLSLSSNLGHDYFPEVGRSGNTEEKHLYLDVVQEEWINTIFWFLFRSIIRSLKKLRNIT